MLGARVDDPGERIDVVEVPQGLNAARGGASANRHEVLGIAADVLNSFDVCSGGDRALNEREVVGAGYPRAACFDEVGDLDPAGDRQQLVLAIQQRQLAAVARSKLPDERSWYLQKMKKPPEGGPEKRGGCQLKCKLTG